MLERPRGDLAAEDVVFGYFEGLHSDVEKGLKTFSLETLFLLSVLLSAIKRVLQRCLLAWICGYSIFVYGGQFPLLYNPTFLLSFAFCLDLYYLYRMLLTWYIILFAWNRQLLP
ncbi:uncharacterized protein LOC114295302 [Camellia sinensis]|uniref:uncharacterized protein LOC114295302 n=1 Tax=Camellia sinensis TaxID=4442 RepID=UPI0010368169|nr:uncharacterized protein LOC114295302 [Camellia sinensis]XP_028095331.1 uncharacterized protein LOC114295302 [Camellia sinensis]XP_028095332.1 uncharacterized protein LOC114295302 [Camellia sinensis]XP_028095333.1 uncharacterized protein LOC114295302 [Camellia sinensis]XP_028095334.1 uncharacterized protein LOC114295302 [Camellia sinensis]XP_028095335.1 uncharacterized protein LOC114295302 [Camellia sinensis]